MDQLRVFDRKYIEKIIIHREIYIEKSIFFFFTDTSILQSYRPSKRIFFAPSS